MVDPLLDLILCLHRRDTAWEKSRLFPRKENVAPITEEEKLRDRLEDSTRCLNKRM